MYFELFTCDSGHLKHKFKLGLRLYTCFKVYRVKKWNVIIPCVFAYLLIEFYPIKLFINMYFMLISRLMSVRK